MSTPRMETLPCPFCDKPRWGNCRKANHCGSRPCQIKYTKALRKQLKARARARKEANP